MRAWKFMDFLSDPKKAEPSMACSTADDDISSRATYSSLDEECIVGGAHAPSVTSVNDFVQQVF